MIGRAALQMQRRDDQINELIRLGEQWNGKLDEQDEGVCANTFGKSRMQ